MVAAIKLKVEIYKMKLFKINGCLLVTEENHYTGEVVDVKSLQWAGRPSNNASIAADIANYYIRKMINPLNRCEKSEESISDFADGIAKANEAKKIKRKGIDWDSLNIDELDGW